MLTPLYISENVPRAIRGLLTGLYQLFIVTGGMIAFWSALPSLLSLDNPLKLRTGSIMALSATYLAIPLGWSLWPSKAPPLFYSSSV